MNQTRRKRPQGPSRKRNPRQGDNMTQQVIPHPPQIQDYTVRHSTRLRFTTNAAAAVAVTFQNLLDTILVASTALAPYDLFYAVKVRRVEVWADAAAGTAVTVSLLFDGNVAGIVGDQKAHTDTSMGIQPAKINAKPSPRSLASNYQVSSNAVAFTLSVPTGAVVDVELSFISSFGTGVAAQNASVGAAAGALCVRGLDGLAVAATKFIAPPLLAQI